jgi:apoptosis-inducing factor 2
MKRIVIIGGGFAGARIANSLQGHAQVTLIDNKNFFEFTPGITRTLVDPRYRKYIEIHHRKYLKKANFHHDSVSNVDKKYVYTSKGERITYDYLVVCSGSRYNVPFKGENLFLADRAHALIESHKRIHDSESILIIGGGLVGIEIAAELATKYRNKEITIVHSDKRLIPRNSQKSAHYVTKFLEERGVRVILNERVIKYDKKRAITDKKQNIKADMILVCTGIVPNSDFLRKNFSKYLDKRKHVIVNEKLQIPCASNIFAVGDVNNVNEEKTAQAAEKQGRVAVKNILQSIKGEELSSYEPHKKPVVISLGKWDAIFEKGNFMISGKIPALIKWLIQIKTMIRYRIRSS